ncbi:P-loop NTPase family protein [Acidiphilium acidophilum]|uniref:DNA replication protein n=1 Tax=Acidiphilium acidophilum TaxID=76588 RepID=A0AAW9DUB0_ACIAO|nr:DNA replication protein [Acidiphilium acidophilum]MDX5932679.1 DNA replication protein [Acidiphilium acidophilum]MEE3500216.1 DNA replication protein [Acidiphilium acidophilum]GBQ07326.1 chromosome replication initiator DnaA [Acidiphilium acidophilum DSM 700]
MSDTAATSRQLALPFDEPEPFSAEDFIAAPSNAAARAALAAPETWVNARLIVWGAAGCGKSHLASVWAAEHGAATIVAARLREAWQPPSAAMVIEDIDVMASPVALFATLESAAGRRSPVLMTSRQPPGRLTIPLPDLASRLRASLAIPIEVAESALLDGLLLRLAANRQLVLPTSLHQFLLHRLPRRPGVLREAIARLDRYALALGTAPSRRIAERLLAELTDPPEASAPEEPKRGRGDDYIENHESGTRRLL